MHALRDESREKAEFNKDLTILAVKNTIPDTFYGRLIIFYIHSFEGAFQFIHQLWIELAHAESEFCANCLNAW